MARLSAGIIGPTFVHLECMLNTDTKKLGFSSIAENLGYIVGSACTLLFYNRGNKEMQVAFSYLWLGLCVILTPYLPNVYAYYVLICVQNIAAGNVDVFSMTYVLKSWTGHKRKDILTQTLHATWIIGSFICPFLVLPFLHDLPKEMEDMIQVETPANELKSHNTHRKQDSQLNYNISYPEMYNQDVSYQQTSGNITTAMKDEVVNVRNAFLTVGLLDITAALVIFLSAVYSRQKNPSVYDSIAISFSATNNKTTMSYKCKNIISTHEENKLKNIQQKKSIRKVLYIMIVCHVSIALVPFYVMNMYLSAFAIKGLHWEIKWGPLLTSLFRGFESLGAILAVPLALFISPGKVLTIGTITSVVGLILMVSLHKYSLIIWFGTVLAGLGVAPLYFSMMLWGSDYIESTATYGALLVAFPALSSMLGAALTGYLFQHYTHMWLLYISLGFSILAGLLFGIMYIITQFNPKLEFGNQHKIKKSVEISHIN